jgi:DNA-binding LytR/AlgR family response regulator
LPPHQFHRIHRSYLINGVHFQKYEESLGEVTLTNNHRVITSRRKKISFEGWILGENKN